MSEARDGSRSTAGLWLLLAGLAVVAMAVSWHVRTLLLAPRSRAIGDGRTVPSYGFQLAPAVVPVGAIVATGMPRDGLPALVEPPHLGPEELAAASARGRSKLLVGGDLVIGACVADQCRAYPLRFLAWHEVVNDTLAGTPVLVTYSPLTDSAVVFERRVAGTVPTFGVSGLLYNSNLLLYDRTAAPGQESLWSQLAMRAVVGPAVATASALRPLPAAVTTWSAWSSDHPGTTVLAPDPRLAAQYRRDPYSSYFGSDELRFPVAPLMPGGALARKAPLLVVLNGEEAAVFPIERVAARADPAGVWRTTVAGRRIAIVTRARPLAAWAVADDALPLVTLRTAAFAWYAFHPESADWVAPAD